eukprot:Sspe_Gene.80492::Locus_50867_Transcript_1_1_Confidence_1.000_Length_898::g.80492::m.80492
MDSNPLASVWRPPLSMALAIRSPCGLRGVSWEASQGKEPIANLPANFDWAGPHPSWGPPPVPPRPERLVARRLASQVYDPSTPHISLSHLNDTALAVASPTPGVGADLVDLPRVESLVSTPQGLAALHKRSAHGLLTDRHPSPLTLAACWGLKECLAKAVGHNELYSREDVALQDDGLVTISGRPLQRAQECGLGSKAGYWFGTALVNQRRVLLCILRFA